MRLSSADGDSGWGAKIKMYAVLQSSWWAGTYVICYRFQPTILLMQTSWGSRVVHWAGGWLQRVAPSRYESIAKLSARVYGSPNGRTVGEWVLINKAISPVVLPGLLGLANLIVNRRALVPVLPLEASVEQDLPPSGVHVPTTALVKPGSLSGSSPSLGGQTPVVQAGQAPVESRSLLRNVSSPQPADEPVGVLCQFGASALTDNQH